MPQRCWIRDGGHRCNISDPGTEPVPWTGFLRYRLERQQELQVDGEGGARRGRELVQRAQPPEFRLPDRYVRGGQLWPVRRHYGPANRTVWSVLFRPALRTHRSVAGQTRVLTWFLARLRRPLHGAAVFLAGENPPPLSSVAGSRLR